MQNATDNKVCNYSTFENIICNQLRLLKRITNRFLHELFIAVLLCKSQTTTRIALVGSGNSRTERNQSK